ncbi:MAG: hypothetical protein ACK5CA_09505 [Cyanobacteriota bacterium]|jgi:hypothetical protein
MNEAKPPPYNQIFEKLVLSTEPISENRLYGMLAYAKYKLEKNRWYKNVNSPTKEMVDAFLTSYDRERLEELVREAENTLLEFADSYANQLLEEKLELYKQDILSQELGTLQKDLTAEINKTKLSFWLPVWQGLVASAIFTFSLFILALIIRFAAPDTSIGRLLQYLLAPDQYELQIQKK